MLLTVPRDLKLASECFAFQTARKGTVCGSVQFHENRGLRLQTIASAIVILSPVSFFIIIYSTRVFFVLS